MSLLSENTRRWNAMHEKSTRIAEAREFAIRAVARKDFYQKISDRVAQHGHVVPWWVIPLIHERECIGGIKNLGCSIGQGSPWNRKSPIVPYTGPYGSFEDAAVASLLSIKNRNWSAGGAMTFMELYNGPGYANRGKPAPYIWAGTDQYVKGKYVRDHDYDPNFVDPQLGVAIMLREMQRADPTIVFEETPADQSSDPHTKEIVTGTAGTGGIAEITHQASTSGMEPWAIAVIVIVAVLAISFVVYRQWKNRKGAFNVVNGEIVSV